MAEQEEENKQNPEKTNEVRPEKASRVVKYLVFANLLVFGFQYYLWYFHPEVDPFNLFALHHYRSEHFRIYQYFTYMFLHAPGFLHIGLNMFILWMFGSSLEYVWSSKKFLFYYFFTGLGAAFLHLAVSTYEIKSLESTIQQYAASPSYSEFDSIVEEEIGEIPPNAEVPYPVLRRIPKLEQKWRQDKDNPVYRERSVELLYAYLDTYIDRPSVGASGAVFGILIAFGMLFPNVLVFIYFLFPMKAKYFVLLLGLLELYFGVFGAQTQIANFAHIGGMVFGFILLKIWGEKPRKTRQG